MSIMLEQLIGAAAISDDIAAVAERVRKSTVFVERNRGNGAGIIWSANGAIVTNRHVVGERGKVRITLFDGTVYEGEVAAAHPTRDLAIVKIEAAGLPAVEIGDSTAIRAGEIAIAVGHPLGYRDAVSTGIFTRSGREDAETIHMDVALLPGNSGGPLTDVLGRVVGVNAMVAGSLGMAVPSARVATFFNQWSNPAARTPLGIRATFVRDLPGEQSAGMVIIAIDHGSPADRAGLIVGDVIVGAGGASLVDEESLPAALLRLGWPLRLLVLRGGEPRTIDVHEAV
jgi:serine protease Do